MRSQAVLLAAAWSLALAGCAPRGKAVVNAAQPTALSIPQTTVALPPPQPLNPAALADTQTPAAPAAPAPLPAAQGPATPVPAPSAAAPSRRREPPPVVTAPAAAAAPPPAPVERPAIQAIIPAEEQRRLKDSADARKREVRAALAKIHNQDLVKRIQFFLAQSDQAERRGDMTQADIFAQRAQELARQ